LRQLLSHSPVSPQGERLKPDLPEVVVSRVKATVSGGDAMPEHKKPLRQNLRNFLRP
jgi:hypothetical protein